MIVREYTPNVIEPSFGIGRILYALLEHSYYTRKEDEQRTVFAFPPLIAPTKVLIVPISHNDAFLPVIQSIVSQLRRYGLSSKVDDSAGSIGRRYSRNDELGTPFAITIDFQTLKDGTVTLRERDSTEQVRGKTDELMAVLESLANQSIDWKAVKGQFPTFIQQEI